MSKMGDKADGATGCVNCPHDEASLKLQMAYRLLMPRDGYLGLDTCNCEPSTRAVIQTCWDGPNKGRRQLKCPKLKGSECSFTMWLDGPITGRAKVVIDFLHSTVLQLMCEKLANEELVHNLEDEYEKFQAAVGFNNEDASTSGAAT